ncbi:major facilitator family transporter [Desulfosarcina variabilis str. Montpellier]|uniref:MFS transporter n=1 Tax=Desulfosarcina variabilis TaxID=2300 RepID=UPI003AFAC4D8
MGETATHPLFRFRWLIFFILASAYFFVYFHRLSLSVVADSLIKDFNTTAGTLGVLGSIYFYCYAFMQLPAGLLSDSVGPRRTVTCFLILAAAGSILFGLASNIATAVVGRILVGFGVSMVFIPTMKILSQWYAPFEFASMAGILNAIGGAGAMAATWLLALMTEMFGWRLSFELIGGCTFLLVGLVWLIVRDRPQDKGWPPIAELSSKPGRVAAPVKTIPLLAGVRQVLGSRYFWPLAIWYFFDCGIFFGFGGLWGGPYLMHVHGLSREETGAVLSMIAWGMIIGSPFLGLVSDRLLQSRKKPFIGCATVLVLEMGLLYLYPNSLPKLVLYGVFFVFSICASAIVAIGFTATKELFPVEIAGTSVGTVNLFPFLGGAIYMPMLGKILDLYPRTASDAYALEGYTTMLLVLLISSIIALGCTLMIKETFRGRQ